MTFIMALFASCSENNEGKVQGDMVTKSPANSEYQISSLSELPFMDYSECEAYATWCADLHNQALSYAYDRLNEWYYTDSRRLYEALHSEEAKNWLCRELTNHALIRIEEENQDLEGMIDLLLTLTNIPTPDKEQVYYQLFGENDTYATILDSINGMYSNKSSELFSYFDHALYEDIEYVSGYYGGSYAPALPLIFGYTMYPYSLEYWQNEYHNWFEVFLQAENENGDGGDSGRDEGGGEEGGGDKGDDKWKEDLKNIGISDAYGAARGAVNACIGLGTGLIVPGVNLGVGGTIALMALSIGVEESIMTALTQSKDDVRMYMIEGVYPSY